MSYSADFLSPAPAGFTWPQCPEADRFVAQRIEMFLGGHTFARRLAQRMTQETSTEFQAWVDYLVLSQRDCDELKLTGVGFVPDSSAAAPAGAKLLWHPFADLPRILFFADAVSPACAIMVESIADFQTAHGLSLPIEGTPLSFYREARLAGEKGELRLIERRGTRSVVPDAGENAVRYIENLQLWLDRPRRFSTVEQGLKETRALAERVVHAVGTGMAAWIFLEAERCYWQNRNRTGQAQKARQDKLGLGWANHDHHTFRSSRPAFPVLIDILKTFGFKKRERYFAGADAGWGAQIMEQPEARLIIFADVDLAPHEIDVDFSAVALPELDKPGTIGLWCALHGESMLEAGMHHLEAKFDFEHLRDSMKGSGVNFMKPFSDFPHLRQAFSEGELWPVPAERLAALVASNRLTKDAYDRIKQHGAVGSHLENLQRRNGFKGFNQKGVSHIIREVNPEAQALNQISGGGA